MKNVIITGVISRVWRECAEDYVGLWAVVAEFRDINDQTQRKTLSLQVVEQLLDDPNIIVGQFENDVYRPWTLAPREAYARIEREWNELGAEPDMGDICWFTRKDEATPTI